VIGIFFLNMERRRFLEVSVQGKEIVVLLTVFCKIDKLEVCLTDEQYCLLEWMDRIEIKGNLIKLPA